MEQTKALDAAFLHLDSRTSALHIASLAFFAGPVPTAVEIQEAIAHKLARVPRLRQRLVTVPFGLGRPVWVDDPTFDITRHVHRIAVPAPGGDEEVREVVEQLLTEPLDHDLPLWADWVLEGVAGNRWALLTKVHHSMVDGIAGTDLLTSLLDPSPRPDWVPVLHWEPSPPPARWRLAVDAIRTGAGLRTAELVALPATVRYTLRQAARDPGGTVASLRRTTAGLIGFAANVRPTRPSSLAGPLGRDRGYGWTEVDLGTVLAIHDRLGTTVNDLVLTAVTGAFRDLLLSRGEEPAPHTVRTLVPVSVRRPEERGNHDNRVSAILLDLPVELDDPRDRLLEVAVRMRTLKDSHEAEVGEQITSVADVLPALPLGLLLHLAFRLPHRNLTTVVTNVPGPSSQLHLAGRALLAPYPYVPIADRLRSGIAVTSYGDRLLFGVTTDRDSMPDAHVLVDGITRGFDDLADLAEVARSTRHTEGAAR